MTVRRRLLGPPAAFLAALALTTTANAQPPRPPGGFPPAPNTADPTTDDIKARIELFLNRGRPGGQFQPNPSGMTPEQLAKLARLAKQFGFEPGPGGKFTPQQQELLKKELRNDPDFRPPPNGMQPKGGPGGLDPQPDKLTRPFEPTRKGDPFKLPPDGKGEPPPKRPVPDNVRPMELDPPRPPNRKGDPRVPPPAPPDDPRLDPPFGPNADKVELPPWQQPESPQDKARQAAASLWERNVGPLDETPAVKKALFDIVEGTGDLKDPDGNNLWDTISKELGDGKNFGDLLNGVDPGDDWNLGGGDWSFPKLNWNFNWGNNRPPDLGSAGPPRESWWSRWRRSPSSSSTSSSSSSPSWFSGWKAPKWNIGIPALDGTWLPVVFLIAALVGGVFLWRWLARRGAVDPFRIDPYALGPWPVDPHRLATRQDVVVAFEHLSVLICGPVAKTWTHTTIAGALSEFAMAEPERALMLARLYELARYTPIEEPLTTAELAEARRLVCRLAGFSDD